MGARVQGHDGGMSNKTFAMDNRENSCDKAMPSTSKEETMTHPTYMIPTSNFNAGTHLSIYTAPTSKLNDVFVTPHSPILHQQNLHSPQKLTEIVSTSFRFANLPSPALIFPLLLRIFQRPNCPNKRKYIGSFPRKPLASAFRSIV
jgi:hypothetical protein